MYFELDGKPHFQAVVPLEVVFFDHQVVCKYRLRARCHAKPGKAAYDRKADPYHFNTSVLLATTGLTTQPHKRLLGFFEDRKKLRQTKTFTVGTKEKGWPWRGETVCPFDVLQPWKGYPFSGVHSEKAGRKKIQKKIKTGNPSSNGAV